MLPLEVFPELPGLSWDTTVTVQYSTRVVTTISGRTIRQPLYTRPIYSFELSFDGLSSGDRNAGLVSRSKQILQEFFERQRGQLGSFVYKDRNLSNSTATNHTVGIGNGVNKSFPARRILVRDSEEVPYLLFISAVRVNQVLSSNWTLTLPNIITFGNAPPNGAVISADYTYGWICRFTDDNLSLVEFMDTLFSARSLKLETVR